jgi:hypothetical protein
MEVSELITSERVVLFLFLGGAVCFVAGFCLCALLVMSRRSADDYEDK